MRKLSRWILVAACIMTAVFCVCACGTENDDSYKVTFNLGYRTASTAEVVRVDPGEKVAKPVDPTRENYAFDAWYTEAACLHAYDFDSEVTQSITLFAGWTQTKATVTFYTGDGSKVDGSNVGVGGTVAKPVDPTLDGYRFMGWYVEPLCRENYEYDFSAKVSENITLYAKWVQTESTIRINLYNEVYADPLKVEIGEKIDASAIAKPTRERYEFTDWYSDAQRTVLYDFGSSVAGNFTLYAGWKQVVAQITYNANYDGAPAAQTAEVSVNAAITAPEPPTRTGYEFTGWFTDAACANEFDLASGTDEDITLYAGWELKTYTVTFDWNFTGSASAQKQVKHGNSVELPGDSDIPQNGGKVFVGWALDKAGTQDFASDTRITENITLYAKWQEASSDKIIIKFFKNDGTNAVTTVDNAVSGRYLAEPVAPTRSGYYFAGWAKGSETGTKWNFGKDRVSGSMDLYAVWLKGYSFEAEYTELEGKYYAGWSNDGVGSAASLIAYASNYKNAAEMKVSGGIYVYSMLYNGAYLDFNITSDKAVTDAVLVLRLAPDGFDFDLDDDTYRVLVNGTRLEYGTLCLPIGKYRTDDMNDQNKPPFVNYLITIELNLNAGDNVIRLQTNNTNEHGGTFAAETPTVDCITVYSSSTLTWTAGKCHPENVNKTAADVTYAVVYEGDFRDTYHHYGENCGTQPTALSEVAMLPANRRREYE